MLESCGDVTRYFSMSIRAYLQRQHCPCGGQIHPEHPCMLPLLPILGNQSISIQMQFKLWPVSKSYVADLNIDDNPVRRLRILSHAA